MGMYYKTQNIVKRFAVKSKPPFYPVASNLVPFLQATEYPFFVYPLTHSMHLQLYVCICMYTCIYE